MKYDDSALNLAMHLLQIKAVKLSPKQPFTWASGLHSPIYCDNRVTLSYPMVRTFIRQQFVELMMQHYGKPDLIAGVATGGIAQGALVAQELGSPFCYVRSEKKSHGMQNQIEVSSNRVNLLSSLRIWSPPASRVFWPWMPCARPVPMSRACWPSSPTSCLPPKRTSPPRNAPYTPSPTTRP